jgi:hypothetical protein
MLDNKDDQQELLDRLLTLPLSEAMKIFQTDLERYRASNENLVMILSKPEFIHEHDWAIEKLKQNIEKVRDFYHVILTYLEKFQVISIDWPDDNGKYEVTLEELEFHPPVGILFSLLLDLRKLTSNIEGYMTLLSEEDLSPEEKDDFINRLARAIKRVQKPFDFILNYLEKLKEMRQSGKSID